MKILVLMLAMVLFAACSSEVEINTFRAKGGPLGDVKVEVMGSDGKTIEASGGTSPNGSLVVRLDYGSYKVKASKDEVVKNTGTYEYGDSFGNIKVDLFGAMSGIRIDIPLTEKKVTVE